MLKFVKGAFVSICYLL